MTWRDGMTCRACGHEERASEGAPCVTCEAFLCQLCTVRGVTQCTACATGASGAAPSATPPATPTADGSAAEAAG